MFTITVCFTDSELLLFIRYITSNCQLTNVIDTNINLHIKKNFHILILGT